METKAEIRKRMRSIRDAIDPARRAEKSHTICDELMGEVRRACCEGAGAQHSLTVAAYAAMGSEVSLDAFVRESYARGWRVCFPAMVARATGHGASAQPMAFFEVSREAFEAGTVPFLAHPTRLFNEAAQESARAAGAKVREVPPREIDCMIVPMVAFDDAGMRLGYGGGNYDRYLPRLRSDARVWGAAFAEQRVASLPAEPHDAPLPRVVVA